MNELKGLQARGLQLGEFASTPLDTPQRLYLAGFVLIAFGLSKPGLRVRHGPLFG